MPYVVSSPTAAGTVALVAPVTTWQAYNQWGGYSLYHGPGGRPAELRGELRPAVQPGATGANDYRTAALPIVVRAERLGIPLSYFTNVDLAHDPADARRAPRAMCRWVTTSTGRRRCGRAVTAARDAGTNLAFLGANTMYWRVRLEDRAPAGPGSWSGTGTTPTSTLGGTIGPARPPRGSVTRRRRTRSKS